jgi:hypothetical protein
MKLLKYFPKIFLPFVLIFISCQAGSNDVSTPLTAYAGIKIYLAQPECQAYYQKNYQKLLEDIVGLGFNTILTPAFEGNISFYKSEIFPAEDSTLQLEKFFKLAHSYDLITGALCPVFHDPSTAAQRPDLVPIDQFGQNHSDGWQRFVCPSDSAYREYKITAIMEIADRLSPDIISLDFIRYPVPWENLPAKLGSTLLRNFCFCERCLTRFSSANEIRIPSRLVSTRQKAEYILTHQPEQWTQWKTEIISGFVREVKQRLVKRHPNIQLAVQTLPWDEDTFENAIERIAGQDIVLMSRWSDMLSPMVYHKLIHKSPDYVYTLTSELAGKTNRTVIPSIQSEEIRDEGHLSSQELLEVIQHALRAPSAGVFIFHWGQFVGFKEQDGPSAERAQIVESIFR